MLKNLIVALINWKSHCGNSAFCSYLYLVILFEIPNFDICTMLGYTAQVKASFTTLILPVQLSKFVIITVNCVYSITLTFFSNFAL